MTRRDHPIVRTERAARPTAAEDDDLSHETVGQRSIPVSP